MPFSFVLESEIEHIMKYSGLEALESKSIHNQMVYMFWGEGGATEGQGSPTPPSTHSLFSSYSKLIRNPLLVVLLFWWWFLIQFFFKTDAECSPGGPPPLVVVSYANVI